MPQSHQHFAERTHRAARLFRDRLLQLRAADQAALEQKPAQPLLAQRTLAFERQFQADAVDLVVLEQQLAEPLADREVFDSADWYEEAEHFIAVLHDMQAEPSQVGAVSDQLSGKDVPIVE